MLTIFDCIVTKHRISFGQTFSLKQKKIEHLFSHRSGLSDQSCPRPVLCKHLNSVCLLAVDTCWHALPCHVHFWANTETVEIDHDIKILINFYEIGQIEVHFLFSFSTSLLVCCIIPTYYEYINMKTACWVIKRFRSSNDVKVKLNMILLTINIFEAFGANCVHKNCTYTFPRWNKTINYFFSTFKLNLLLLN